MPCSVVALLWLAAGYGCARAWSASRPLPARVKRRLLAWRVLDKSCIHSMRRGRVGGEGLRWRIATPWLRSSLPSSVPACGVR